MSGIGSSHGCRGRRLRKCRGTHGEADISESLLGNKQVVGFFAHYRKIEVAAYLVYWQSFFLKFVGNAWCCLLFLA